MRTLNVKKGDVSKENNVSSMDVDGFNDRQPCWFADFNSLGNRCECEWRVGCIKNGDVNEYVFTIDSVGDVNDLAFWYRITCVSFAVDLINTFRNGGKYAVEKWIKNGCNGMV